MNNKWFLEPTPAHNPNGISIRSAVFFAGLTTVTRACERSGIAVENGVERAEN